MSINELCIKGAAELAAMIRDRKVTSGDVVTPTWRASRKSTRPSMR